MCNEFGGCSIRFYIRVFGGHFVIYKVEHTSDRLVNDLCKGWINWYVIPKNNTTGTKSLKLCISIFLYYVVYNKILSIFNLKANRPDE